MQKTLRYADQLRRLLHRSMQPLGEDLNLSQLQMELLLFLHNNPELNTARDAVAYRGFAKSNVSTAVEALEKKGWLTVKPDPKSRRVKRLCLSIEREAELSRLVKCQTEVICALTAGFTEGEKEMLQNLLDRLGENAARELEKLEGNYHA